MLESVAGLSNGIPDESPACPVPSDNGIWLDDNQMTPPVWKKMAQHGPQQTIWRLLPGSFGVPLKDIQLMAQGYVFKSHR